MTGAAVVGTAWGTVLLARSISAVAGGLGRCGYRELFQGQAEQKFLATLPAIF